MSKQLLVMVLLAMYHAMGFKIGNTCLNSNNRNWQYLKTFGYGSVGYVSCYAL